MSAGHFEQLFKALWSLYLGDYMKILNQVDIASFSFLQDIVEPCYGHYIEIHCAGIHNFLY